MSFVAVAVAGSAVAGLGGAALMSSASKDASQAQVQMGQQALGQQQQFSQQGLQTLLQMFGEAKGAEQPVIDAGRNVLSSGQDIVGSVSPVLQKLLTPGADMTETLSQLPGFKFAQDWGQKAITNQGSTTGFSGNTLKAGADYATGAAQQGFSGLADLLLKYLGGGSALTATGGNIMTSGAGGIAGAASGAGSSAFGNLTQTGQNIGSTLTGIGNAQASGTLGQANAWAGGLQSAGNTGINALLLSKLLPGGGGFGGGTPALGIYGKGGG